MAMRVGPTLSEIWPGLWCFIYYFFANVENQYSKAFYRE